jgi:putative ABC transport system permease protein
MLRALCRVMLIACPRDVRREYGDELEAVFLHCVSVERARRSWFALPIVLGRGIGDLLIFSVAAQVSTRRGTPRAQTTAGEVRRPFMRGPDYRSVWRLVRKQPALTAAVVLMLGLGIGATTALSSVVYGALLKPMPFPEPDRLVQVWGSIPSRNLPRVSLTEGTFWDLHEINRVFEEYGVLRGTSFSLTGDGTPQRVTGARVSVGFFRALGVRPIVGRIFEPGDDDPGVQDDRVLLSHALWTSRFAGDRAIAGRTIMLDGRSRQVVGVLPAGRPWLDAAEAYVPFGRRATLNRTSWEWSSVGRLKPGVTIDQARDDLARAAREMEARFPKEYAGNEFTVGPSRGWIASDDLRRMLWILLGAVGLLLVIACVNVTNLLLAQASARERETAVRAALGATGADIVRERLTESLGLGAMSALVGVAVADGLLRVFKAFDPGGIPRLAEATIDIRALALSVLVAVLVGIGTGLVPAWRARVGLLASALRHGQRGTVGDRHNDRLRGVFVAAEVALSLMLLVGAGLLVRSLAQVLSTDRGFQTDQRLIATVSIPSAYNDDRRTQISTTILERLERHPQVVAVAAVSARPLSPGSTGLGIVAADRPGIADSDVPWASWRLITRDYFKTMGLQLVSGRAFTEQDMISKPWRAIISRRLAEQLWPGESPVGKTAILWKGQGNTPAEIIGVVSDMRERGLEAPPTLAVYFPAYGALNTTSLQVVMHTRGNPDDMQPALRAIVTEIDPTLPLSGIRSLEDVVSSSVATRRFTMMLLATFAGIALLLAVAGVYGVLAYSVARRTPEFGVRLALGASPSQVLRRVFSRGMRPVVVGLAIGLAGAIWIGQLMTSLLFNVQPGDFRTYATVVAVLLATAGLACYLPARRVLRVDPVVALRAE